MGDPFADKFVTIMVALPPVTVVIIPIVGTPGAVYMYMNGFDATDKADVPTPLTAAN
jgi:hypothetical protein